MRDKPRGEGRVPRDQSRIQPGGGITAFAKPRNS